METWGDVTRKTRRGNVWIPEHTIRNASLISSDRNPSPAYTNPPPKWRQSLHLFDCGVNVDTGKMAWYYQTSPHDTHDSTPPKLDPGDADFNASPETRAASSRNGYYFTLDRLTGERL